MLVLAEHDGFVDLVLGLLPRVLGQPGLARQMAQGGLAIPALLGRDLRQEGGAVPADAEDDAVLADHDLLGPLDGHRRRQHRDLDGDEGQLRDADRMRKARVLQRRARGAHGHGLVDRLRRLDGADATAQIVAAPDAAAVVVRPCTSASRRRRPCAPARASGARSCEPPESNDPLRTDASSEARARRRSVARSSSLNGNIFSPPARAASTFEALGQLPVNATST